MSAGLVQVYGLLALFFIGIPAKILFDNAAGLRAIARFAFALTSPVIFFFCMMGTFSGFSWLLDTSLNIYLALTGALTAISFAVLVVWSWYRLLKIIGRNRSPIEGYFFSDS